MKRINCWEHRACGREPKGYQSNELGICPATTEKRLNGVNRGINGGRACWALQNTTPPNSFTEQLQKCLNCIFFQLVEFEEDRGFLVMGKILKLLK